MKKGMTSAIWGKLRMLNEPRLASNLKHFNLVHRF